MTRPAAPPRADAPRRDITASGGVVTLTFSGSWRMDQTLPDIEAVRQALAASPAPQKLVLAGEGVTGWDSLFLTQCRAIIALARERGVAVDAGALPPGVESLLALAAKVPERQGAARAAKSTPFLERMADMGYGAAQGVRNLLDFTGDVTLAAWALVTGRAVFQRSQLTTLIYQASIDALGIVSLISFLVGLILAFVGAIQLSQFGAQIYVSTIVGIAMVRVMGAIMTGIIMAGRTGAAYAAELGTMQVNEEIDALRTMGISPVGFLVLPRMFALALMLPLLCVYADIMGILGGSLIGVTMLDLSLVEFLDQARKTIQLGQFGQGLLKSSVFGVLIGYAGCLRGMQCGRSALAVGEATTSAVVTSIVLIVVSDSIITYFLYR